MGGDPDKPLFRGNGFKVEGFIYAMAPKYFSAEESQRQFAIIGPLRVKFLKARGLSAELTDDDRIAEAAYLNQKLDALKESFRVQFVSEMHALHTISYRGP